MRTREEILSQWERQPLDQFTYYAHCRSGDGIDTFKIGDKLIGWRNVGISGFISFGANDKFGVGIKGRFWEEGMLLFPAGAFTVEEIETCIGTDNL